MSDRERYQQLQQRAMKALARPEDHPPRVSHRVLLRLWESPSFERPRSWALLSAFDSPSGLADEPASLRTLTWDSTFDAQRFTDPLFGLKHGFSMSPTLVCQDQPLTDEQARTLLSGLEHGVIPVKPEGLGICLDGVRYGLEFCHGPFGVRLNWWGDLPKEWASLQRWYWQKREFIDQLDEADGV